MSDESSKRPLARLVDCLESNACVASWRLEVSARSGLDITVTLEPALSGRTIQITVPGHVWTITRLRERAIERIYESVDDLLLADALHGGPGVDA